MRLADRWATWIVAIALFPQGLMATGELIRAVTILVVFCPCALGWQLPRRSWPLSRTPPGMASWCGKGCLERLSCVSHLTFDKTGTLTAVLRAWRPCAVSAGAPEQELYRYAPVCELRSEHPLGKAIVRCYRKDSVQKLQPEQFA
ncbi:MAG: hypothetical protein ACLSUW_01865 [Akkermansia sp.]